MRVGDPVCDKFVARVTNGHFVSTQHLTGIRCKIGKTVFWMGMGWVRMFPPKGFETYKLLRLLIFISKTDDN